MLSTDLVLNPSTAIAAGSATPLTYSLLESVKGTSVRSDPSVATTNPRNVRISHSTRVSKTKFKLVANASVPAPDVVFDRHLVRLDSNVTQSTHLDPQFAINRSVQIVIELPRLGASTPTVVQLMDDLLAIVSMLRAGTNANLIKLLNNET